MNYKIRKAEKLDMDDVLRLGRKIVDVCERTHLGDQAADRYINSGDCSSGEHRGFLSSAKSLALLQIV